MCSRNDIEHLQLDLGLAEEADARIDALYDQYIAGLEDAQRSHPNHWTCDCRACQNDHAVWLTSQEASPTNTEDY